MKALQLIFLAGFALFAFITLLLQLWYGHITGKSDYQDRQQDPRAKACARYSMVCAMIAAICLIVCMVLGALARQ